jgi:hypothetical protein
MGISEKVGRVLAGEAGWPRPVGAPRCRLLPSFSICSGCFRDHVAVGCCVRRVTKTDSNGVAGVVATLGSAPGPVIVTATLAGLQPVQFHLTATATVPTPFIAVGVSAGLKQPQFRRFGRRHPPPVAPSRHTTTSAIRCLGDRGERVSNSQSASFQNKQ